MPFRTVGKIVVVDRFADINPAFAEANVGAIKLKRPLPAKVRDELQALPGDTARIICGQHDSIIAATARLPVLQKSFSHTAGYLTELRDEFAETAAGHRRNAPLPPTARVYAGSSLHTPWHYDSFGDAHEPEYGLHVHFCGHSMEGLSANGPQVSVALNHDLPQTSRFIDADVVDALIAAPGSQISKDTLAPGEIYVFNHLFAHRSGSAVQSDGPKMRCVIK